MKERKPYFLLALLLFCCTIATPSFAAWTLKNGKLVDADVVATLPIEEHYELGCSAYTSSQWNVAANHLAIVVNNSRNIECVQDANFYLGVCYFRLAEFDFANDAFTNYIKDFNQPKFFIEAIEYKFCIAEAFRKGAPRRFFGTKKMPKWASGRSLGMQIYDEVIAALPSHDVAARALYCKGYVKWEFNEYRESVECFQLLTKRFPKHELAPECYLCIAKVYYDQAQSEFQNPDIISFAEINVKRFKRHFPKDERCSSAEQDVMNIKEVYANGLYETGRFYERTKKPYASVIYYKNAVRCFPDTNVAQECIRRLNLLDPGYAPPAPEVES